MPIFTGYKFADYILYIFVVLPVAWLLLRFWRMLHDRFINRRTHELGLDPTHYVFLKNALSFIVYSIPAFKERGVSRFAEEGVEIALPHRVIINKDHGENTQEGK